jgi:hypothetical protein
VLVDGPRHAIGLRPWIPKWQLEVYSCEIESFPLTPTSPCEDPRSTIHYLSVSGIWAAGAGQIGGAFLALGSLGYDANMPWGGRYAYRGSVQ